MNEISYRVYNRCKHAIGVKLMNGVHVNIKPGSFRLLTASDILYIESVCGSIKFFAQKMLVPYDAENKIVALENIGLYEDPDVVKHMTDDEITAMLKKSQAQVKAWLSDITDPAELHAIYLVAKTMDISASKLRLLNEKMPNKAWLDSEE